MIDEHERVETVIVDLVKLPDEITLSRKAIVEDARLVALADASAAHHVLKQIRHCLDAHVVAALLQEELLVGRDLSRRRGTHIRREGPRGLEYGLLSCTELLEALLDRGCDSDLLVVGAYLLRYL